MLSLLLSIILKVILFSFDTSFAMFISSVTFRLLISSCIMVATCESIQYLYVLIIDIAEVIIFLVIGGTLLCCISARECAQFVCMYLG